MLVSSDLHDKIYLIEPAQIARRVGIDYLDDIAGIAGGHHERLGGKGYPYGLKGMGLTWIPGLSPLLTF